MKINCSIGAIGVILVLMLSPTACDAPQPVSPRGALEGTHGLSAPDDLRLSALASADSNQLVDAQVEYLTKRSIQDVAHLSRDGSNVQIVGFSHAFRYKSQVQVGVFDLPDALSGAAAVDEYKRSTREFLREMVRSTDIALGDEKDAANRQSYRELLQAFKLRLAEFDRDKPGIYSLRVRARAGFLAGLRVNDKTVRTVSLSDGPQKKFRAPSLPTEIDPIASSPGVICPYSVGGGPSTSLEGGVTVSSFPLPDPCEPPPDGGDPATPPPSYQGPPSTETGISPNLPLYISDPLSDPYSDDAYYDDNSVDNTYWAPTEGKTLVDFDAYSKYTQQHWMWKFPHLTLYIAAGSNKKFSFEGEVHQDGRNGQPVFARGYWTPRGPSERGEVWESNFPAAYLDTDALDRADVPNHTVGTVAPERLQYNTFYYTWIRFGPYGGSPSGKVQIAAQLGDRSGFCGTPNGWCSLNSLSTVRVLPWICGYRAPNRTTMGGKWKRWYWDGKGYKNEQCQAVL